MATSLGELPKSAGEEVLRKYFKSVIENDTFALGDHPFKTQINGGKPPSPHLAGLPLHRRGQGRTIEVSSSSLREGRAWGTDRGSPAWLLRGLPRSHQLKERACHQLRVARPRRSDCFIQTQTQGC